MATPFVKELVDYLEDQSIGTVGTDLFYDHLPDTEATTTMAAVRDTGGPSPPGNIPHRDVTVQVMVRGADYATARQFAAKIHNLFHGMVSVTLTYNVIMSSEAVNMPMSIGPDKNERNLISGNYLFRTYANTDSGETSTGFGGDKDPNLN